MITSKVPEKRFKTGRVEFELDRFERTSDQRYEVEGRWSGVRGRRFMRPALTILVDGRELRLLADLAGKPWPAQDGARWLAAFPYPADAVEFDEAELTVAPDVTIPLAVGDPPGAEPTAEAAPASAEDRPAARRDARTPRIEALQRELATAREQRRRLDAQLREREDRIDEAVRRADDAAADLARLECERDQARRECATLAANCDSLQRRQAELSADFEAARHAHDEIAGERRAALADRRIASCEREQAIEARARALVERDAASSECDALKAANAKLQAELSELLTARGAAWAARNIGLRPAEPLSHREAVPRALAAIGLMIVVAIVLLIVLPNA